jgi:beta-lactamase regulating signal transducer with metallopeptidase domain
VNATIHAAIDFLAAHGPTFLAGGTLLLTAGALATVAQPSPATRQRAAEMTILAILVWSIAACVPLPRHDFARWFSRHTPAVPLRNETDPASRPVGETVKRRHEANDLNLALVDVPPDLLIDSASTGRLGGTRASATSSESNQSATQTEMGRAAFPTRFDWPRWGALVYVFGTMGSLAWLLLGRVLLWRLLRAAKPPERWLAALFAQVIDGVASGRVVAGVRLLVSRRCRRPISCGLLRPTIVLPAGHCRSEHSERLRSVLLHELGHIERGDAWGHQLFHLALPIWFFHPLYWYLRSAAQMSRELIADDCAARQSSPEAYVRQLIALVRETSPGHAPAAASAIFTSRTQFYRRMTMLIRRESPLATQCTLAWRSAAWAAMLVVVSAASWTLGVEPIAAQSAPNNVPATKLGASPDSVASQDKRDQSTPSADEPAAPVLGVVVDYRDTQAGGEKAGASERVRVEIGSDDGLVTGDEAAQKALEAELMKLEKQVQDLRDRLAKASASAETRRTKNPGATTERFPASGSVRYIRRTQSEKPKDDVSRLPADEHAIVVESTPPATAAAPAGVGQPSTETKVAGLHLDVVRLAEAYADAAGGVDIAKARLEQAIAAAQEASAGAAMRAEIRVHEITVRTAQRKFASLRRIAEAVTAAADEEAKASEDEIKHLKQLFEKGYVTESHVRDAVRRHQAAQANVKTLRSILAE